MLRYDFLSGTTAGTINGTSPGRGENDLLPPPYPDTVVSFFIF